MKSLQFLLFAALACSLCACKSSEKSSVEVDPASVPCICGTPEAAFDGCDHGPCAMGEGNPDNDDCVCSTIHVGEGE